VKGERTRRPRLMSAASTWRRRSMYVGGRTTSESWGWATAAAERAAIAGGACAGGSISWGTPVTWHGVDSQMCKLYHQSDGASQPRK
jgi:hypothetical protein